MKLFILCITLWAFEEVASSGVTIGLTPYSHAIQAQYQLQDAYGQYVYGYATPTSSKSEVKSANGITQGGYSYIDPNGILQSIRYVSDPVNGFRVAATNLPEDVPEVALAKLQHLAQYETTKLEHGLIAQNGALIVPNVVVANHVRDLPEVIRARAEHLAAFEATKARDLQAASEALIGSAPARVVGNVVPVRTVPNALVHTYSYVPAISTSSQYQTQDNLGQYSYGYVSPLSSKNEIKTVDGVTRGGYSYLDANGIVQTVNYVSDPVNGFRVAATNLPQDAPVRLVAPAAATTRVVAATAPVAPLAHETVVVSAAPATYSSPVVRAADVNSAQVLNIAPLASYKSEITYV